MASRYAPSEGPARSGTPGGKAGASARNVGFTNLNEASTLSGGDGGSEVLTIDRQWSNADATPFKPPSSAGLDSEPPLSDGLGGGRRNSREMRRRSQEKKDPNAVFGALASRAEALRGDAEAGDARSGVLLGYMYVDIGDRATAEHWFQRGAKKHDSEAHFALGMLSKTSPEAEAPQGDVREAAYAAAARHLSRAAKQGHVVAAYRRPSPFSRLARSDWHRSGRFFDRCASLGIAPLRVHRDIRRRRRYHLGSQYANGVGVSRDVRIAERFLRTAATAGCVGAMNALAALLEGTAYAGRPPPSSDVPEDLFDGADDDGGDDGAQKPTYVSVATPAADGFDEDNDGGKKAKRVADAALWYARVPGPPPPSDDAYI